MLDEARLAGDRRLEARGVAGYALACLYGPMAVEEAIAQCEARLEILHGDLRTEGLLLLLLGQLYAMRGPSTALATRRTAA